VTREFDSAYWLGRMVGHLEWILEEIQLRGHEVPAAGPAEMTLEEYRQARGSYLLDRLEART
jgi:hypothetical protein